MLSSLICILDGIAHLRILQLFGCPASKYNSSSPKIKYKLVILHHEDDDTEVVLNAILTKKEYEKIKKKFCKKEKSVYINDEII